jgi:hypothetical protein
MPEIERLRAVIQMVGDHAAEDCSLPELLRILDGLGTGITRLSGVLKTERQFGEEQDPAAALNEALAEVIQEMGLEGRR